MPQLTFSRLNLPTLQQFVRIRDRGVGAYDWLQSDDIALSDREQTHLDEIQARLLNERVQLMNEATVWSRVIYPMLILAERDTIQAWAGVPLSAQYPKFILEGIADGVLGQSIAGQVEVPHLLVVEAKRGLEAQNPQVQLYGEILAAAFLNWKGDQRVPQEMFGCYTISEVWTFVRGEIEGFETDQPNLRVESSREFSERLEAATILKILKGIIARRLAQTELASTG
ncbi:MAG: hypothetical protein VKK04_17760 [Synechococcales bacterium]|nr:hypothetical protein [Synechococcales bacterium]